MMNDSSQRRHGFALRRTCGLRATCQAVEFSLPRPVNVHRGQRHSAIESGLADDLAARAKPLPASSAPPGDVAVSAADVWRAQPLGKPAADEEVTMSVTAFQDLPLADRDREWDGTAAEQRVRRWADAQDGPNDDYRDAHVWYDKDNKDNFGGYKLLIADVVNGKLTAVPRAVMAAGAVMQGLRGGVDLPASDIDRVKSHLAKYYAKMDDTAPWERE